MKSDHVRAAFVALGALLLAGEMTPARAGAEVWPSDLRLACSVYAPGLVVSALQHGEESAGEEGARTTALLREAAAEAGWSKTFAAFARTGAPVRLLAAAKAEARRSGAAPRYSPSACRSLAPVLAAAATAEIMAANGVRVVATPLLMKCDAGRCLAPEIAVIGTRCDLQPFDISAQPICR